MEMFSQNQLAMTGCTFYVCQYNLITIIFVKGNAVPIYRFSDIHLKDCISTPIFYIYGLLYLIKNTFYMPNFITYTSFIHQHSCMLIN